MIVDLLLSDGTPLRVQASLVVAQLDDGTPVLVAGDHGPAGGLRASNATDPDFQATLHELGINKTVLCDVLQMPGPPPGARLVRGSPLRR